jgi:hypothetical protein
MDTRWLRLDLRLLSSSKRGAGRASPSHFRIRAASITRRPRDMTNAGRLAHFGAAVFNQSAIVMEGTAF